MSRDFRYYYIIYVYSYYSPSDWDFSGDVWDRNTVPILCSNEQSKEDEHDHSGHIPVSPLGRPSGS